MRRPEGVQSRPSPRAPRPAEAKPVVKRSVEKRVEEPAEAHADPEVPSLRAAVRERRRYERVERKRFTRSSRRRRMRWLIALGVVVVVLGGSALVSVSPLMALRTVTVVGTSRVSATDVQKALDAQLGTPLPLIDYRRVKTELGRFSLIRTYTTQVEPPGTLVVRVQERTPLAVLNASGGFDLVDQAGVVIERSPAAPKGYPLVTYSAGASGAQKEGEFAATAAVLAALPAATLAQVTSASATNTQDVTLDMTSKVTVVWGGPGQADLKAKVLAALIKAAPRASVYDVSAPDNPVVK